MRLIALLPLLLLLGCGQHEGQRPAAGREAAQDLREVAVSAPILGDLVRAGQACGLPVSPTALDRAARIEAVAIAYHERQGGVAARDDFLRSMAPPAFDPRQRGRDRAGWCGAKRVEIERVDGFLSGPDGAALAERAEAAAR